MTITAGGRWEFVPIDGGGGAHGGQLRYHSRKKTVVIIFDNKKVLFYEEKKRESMKALQHMEMIDDEADMFGIRQVSSSLKTRYFISPRFVRIVDAALAEDYSLWTLPALAFFRQRQIVPLYSFLHCLYHSSRNMIHNDDISIISINIKLSSFSICENSQL